MAAIAILSSAPRLTVAGHHVDGQDQTPDQMLALIHKTQESMYVTWGGIPNPKEEELTFEQEVERLINKKSMERASNTPDFILAKYLLDCLSAFNLATNRRFDWYHPTRSEVGIKAPE